MTQILQSTNHGDFFSSFSVNKQPILNIKFHRLLKIANLFVESQNIQTKKPFNSERLSDSHSIASPISLVLFDLLSTVRNGSVCVCVRASQLSERIKHFTRFIHYRRCADRLLLAIIILCYSVLFLLSVSHRVCYIYALCVC